MQIAANIALVKNLTFHGVFWGSYMQNNPRVLQQSLVELISWLDQGRITVPVSHRCSLVAPFHIGNMAEWLSAAVTG